MKKIFLLLIIPFLSFGQTQVTNSLYNNQSSIKSLRITTKIYGEERRLLDSFNRLIRYNKDGNKIEEIVYRGSNDYESKETWEYMNGHLIENLKYSENLKLDQKIKYIRDDDGSIKDAYLIVFEPTGYFGDCACLTHIYEFNSLKHIHTASCSNGCVSGWFIPTEEIYESDSEEFCEYFKYNYSLYGESNYEGNSTSMWDYEYDSNGREVHYYEYSKGHPELSCSYKYNLYGDLIEEDCCCDMEFEGTITRFRYQYDKKGNRLSKIESYANYMEEERPVGYFPSTSRIGGNYIYQYEFDKFGEIKNMRAYRNNNKYPNKVITYQYIYY